MVSTTVTSAINFDRRSPYSGMTHQDQSIDARGKHRILAELKRLEQETRFVEEELEQLETTDNATVACTELMVNVEAKPDPLLPETTGPVNPSWDRWFEGPQNSKGCRCWIF